MILSREASLRVGAELPTLPVGWGDSWFEGPSPHLPKTPSYLGANLPTLYQMYCLGSWGDCKKLILAMFRYELRGISVTLPIREGSLFMGRGRPEIFIFEAAKNKCPPGKFLILPEMRKNWVSRFFFQNFSR